MANGSCPRGGMRWKLFGDSFKNKELCSFFNGKENGKKEMIKEKLQLLEKALEKVKINFENRLVCFRYKRRRSGLTNV